jgi:hypothetical protein
MADPTEEDKLATAFAKGLELYENSKAERDAKANASTEGNAGDNDTPPAKRSIAERLLGL